MLLLQKLPQSATDFVFKDKKGVLDCFTQQSAEQSQWQTVETSEEEA